MIDSGKLQRYLYTGPLANCITEFLLYKRMTGYVYNAEGFYLGDIDRMSFQLNTKSNCLPKEFVQLWALKRITESHKTWSNRVVVIRKLAEFMRSQDFDAYVTPIVIKNRRSNFTPHIYTNSQLKQIFTQADFCPSYTNCPNRNAVASLIFRMIYGCGLRLSEALNLNVRDVDLENGVLIILNSKFKTNRLTPMAPELTERCRFFYSALHLFSEPDAVFFPAPDGGRYSQEAIGRTFHQILSSAGISRTETGPRIHDLRNTHLNKIRTFFNITDFVKVFGL